MVAAILGWFTFVEGWIAGWWLLAPLFALIALVIYHERVVRRQQMANRAVDYYDRGLARLEDRWIGKGASGERFRDASHVYADDLDVFGRGSLFELLSTARTGAGEQILAGWLMAPTTPAEILARQEAVAELSTRIDLREELALLGEDIRAGIHAERLAAWGVAPAVPFPRGARVFAVLLAASSVLTFGLYMWQVTRSTPFLVAAALAFVAGYILRGPTMRVVQAVETPAQDLRLLTVLLERLERERFTAKRLVELRAELETQGVPASRRIAQLERWIDLLDSADHALVRVLAPFLLWRQQCAMAIESWRSVSGAGVGRWIAAVGELEALCSLAGFAYEHAQATLPEIRASGPYFEADALCHPLLSARQCVPNDVRLGGDLRLLIVSGSNMSGKSTLLRAIGLNAVLAWAGAPVLARRLCLSELAVGASIRVLDSLQDGRSRFYAEITRLRQVADMAGSGRAVLFLLDELLSGTNSHDRRIGAEAILRGLVERGAVGLITTHDLALAHIAEALGPRATNVHFEDQLENGQISFDFILRPGVVERSNALELMRAVGLDV